MFTGITLQIISALIATLSAFVDGMHFAWTAPIVPVLRRPESPIKITPNDVTLLETIYLSGGVVGLPITIFLVNKIGRKKSILTASAINLIAWIIIGTADQVQYLYLARFLGGLEANVNYVSTPMYLAEIAEEKFRGVLSGSLYVMVTFGMLTIYSVAPFLPFYVPSVVAGVLLVTQLVTFGILPESPYYLMKQGQEEKAKAALLKLRGNLDKLETISSAVRQQQRERGRLRELFSVSNNRRAFTIVLYLTAAQHFSGITPILMNLHTILVDTDSTFFNYNMTAILFVAVMLITSIVTSFFLDKLGRKFLLIISSIVCGSCLLIMAVYFHLKTLGKVDSSAFGWIPLVAVMTYAAGFRSGIGLVPIVLASELFSMNVKALGMSLSDGMYVTFGFICIEIYQSIVHYCGYYVPFYIFTIVAFVTAVFAFFVIPETKGKSLEEIQILLKKRKPTHTNDKYENCDLVIA
ncbi:Facilitated trehalose transporter Tret1-2 homolog-like Protein [Tribolium castaneum]|uniref:Facilitated trehalose transporter Tret1-2 homolog-like Protein n=1 Tax=Tribolium castaneum TaxID=7070 RepID=D6X0L7_TRICA|nr:PREDICTED: facilitated trehalose transporter Tret1 [Tribolium castaneum]EFA10111.2 Facilitated trehalose transporter Tret1-2 homolog-like Protein [Tribolium castaneum]|eukprot:XP_972726.2 PREDICTED: facilitated trehalose transporter Tret1 [Tribolium castaneum]